MSLRKGLLGACLALPLAGFAGAAHAKADPPGQVIRVPAGAPAGEVVLILPGAAPQFAARPAAMPGFAAPAPMIRFIAEQNAMLRQMIRQVRALRMWSLPLPGPTHLLRAALHGMAPLAGAPGAGVMTTMVSDGPHTCRETIAYRLTAPGAQPQVHVTRTGDDCAALMPGQPLGVRQALPAAPAPRSLTPATVIAQANRAPLWTVSDPPHPAAAPHA